MKIKDITSEGWSAHAPLDVADLEDWDQRYAKQLSRYHEIEKSPKITRGEAEMLIAADKDLFHYIADYKFQNTPIGGDISNKLINIMKRIEPIDKTFYRGVEYEGYDDKHMMKFQSWSESPHTAKVFGDVIYQTIGSVKGVELGEVYYWHGLLYGEASGLGDSQAEWFLLNPKKKLVYDSN